MIHKISKKLLIISAHADDSLSCAGTVFKLINEFGYSAFELVLTNSSQGQGKSSLKDPNQIAKIRQSELLTANKFLGISKTFNLDQPDLGLTYSQQNVFKIVKIIRQLKPNIVFIHNDYDAHPDHLVAHQLSVSALRLAATNLQSDLLGPSHRTCQILCCEGMLTIKPQILVDITKYFAKKTQLFKLFVSQASPKAIGFEKSLSIVRGYHLRTQGSKAEGFSLQTIFPSLLFQSHEPDIS